MINLKRLLTNVLNTLNGKVSKDGDTMSGDLIIEKEADTCRFRVETTNNGNPVAGGQFACNDVGNFGIFDRVHNKWLVRSDSDGTVHVPITPTLIRSAKAMANSVGTSYTYVSVPALNKWNMVAIRFSVHENSQLLFFIRDEMIDRSLTDWPSAGKFRGTILVDWNNNRIGIRCINAGTQGIYRHLVFFDYVYGVF